MLKNSEILLLSGQFVKKGIHCITKNTPKNIWGWKHQKIKACRQGEKKECLQKKYAKAEHNAEEQSTKWKSRASGRAEHVEEQSTK